MDRILFPSPSEKAASFLLFFDRLALLPLFRDVYPFHFFLPLSMEVKLRLFFSAGTGSSFSLLLPQAQLSLPRSVSLFSLNAFPPFRSFLHPG